MNVLDLFSGIGGFSLGLERAGMRTVAFCEIDPYCQHVLRKHWPDVPVYGDVRKLTADQIVADPDKLRCDTRKPQQSLSRFGQYGEASSIDVICGGFPCQDISVAGKGEGITGERSGLWSEYARIIGEVRPRYVIVENVAALLGRGLERVLGDLAALGFSSVWHCIPASAIGAPHRRDRIWIVAYSDRGRQLQSEGCECEEWRWVSHGGQDMADAMQPRLSVGEKIAGELRETAGRQPGKAAGPGSWWFSEPDVGRVAHGVPFRVDRLRALGNAIVPQIAEIIGRAIMSTSE